MSDIEQVFDLDNLRRAYRWIMSNPDPQYKAYFRESYDAFAVASDTHLRWIRQEGLKERYTPSHASKVHTPKASGTLRPITLLTVDDQIVYQACVNLIADELKKKTRHRYERRVFAHLYAGKSSPFFYKQWQSSYRKFARRIREAHANGYECIANFDLTSFYDSIDHFVLRHFLKELNIDEDTATFLLDCLRVWTSSTWSNGPVNIYHEHGIPQGPLASGMLSEAVLHHLDSAGEQGTKTIYVRYVDDIKILAKNEGELRRKIIKLDLSSKEIGLFPQTSKINIRRITNPDDEVKSVSRPPEPSVEPFVDQKKLTSRLLELTRNGNLNTAAATRFKYLLSHATPSYRLNNRLMQVLVRHPEHATVVAAYISRYTKVPEKLGQSIVDYIRGPELYHFVNGALLRSCLGKLSSKLESELGKFCADRLMRPRKGAIPPQPSYKDALIAWALKARTISFAEYEKLHTGEPDWWVRKASLRELTSDLYGGASYTEILNKDLRNTNPEVSRAAAVRIFQEKLKIAKPVGTVEINAKRSLKAVGVLRSGGQPDSRINVILAYILARPETDYEWKKFFGKEHRHAEMMSIFLKRNRETNIDTFIVQLDSYCDFVTEQICRRYKPPTYKYPFYGSALADPALQRLLPVAMAAFKKLHDLRLESATAHPKSKKSGVSTRRLKHRDYYRIRPEIERAFSEIEAVVVL